MLTITSADFGINVAGAAEALLGDTQIRVFAPDDQRGRSRRRRKPKLSLEPFPAALFGHVFLHGPHSASSLVLHRVFPTNSWCVFFFPIVFEISATKN